MINKINEMMIVNIILHIIIKLILPIIIEIYKIIVVFICVNKKIAVYLFQLK